MVMLPHCLHAGASALVPMSFFSSRLLCAPAATADGASAAAFGLAAGCCCGAVTRTWLSSCCSAFCHRQIVYLTPFKIVSYINFDEKDTLDEKRACFENALRENPLNAVAHNNLAYILHYDYCEYALARVHYERAIAIAPKNAITFSNFADLLCEQFGEYDLAKQMYEQALSVEPANGAFHNSLGLLLKNHFADYAAARCHYENAVAADPSETGYHFNLGMLLEIHFDDYAGARLHFEQIVRTDPTDMQALRHLGSILSEYFSEQEAAENCWSKVMSIVDPHFELDNEELEARILAYGSTRNNGL